MSVRGKAQAMSGAGLAVVVTMCLCLLAVVGTACALAIREQDTPEVLDRVLQGLLIGVPALLAKTYRDARQDHEDEPVPVTPITGPEPLEVVAVEPDGGDTYGHPRQGVPLRSDPR